MQAGGTLPMDRVFPVGFTDQVMNTKNPVARWGRDGVWGIGENWGNYGESIRKS